MDINSLLAKLISALSDANDDFRVEVISSIKVAVIFLKNIDVKMLVNVCNSYHRIWQRQIFPRFQ